ncbi:hypothetical protein TRVL_05085 [Trypanosoma vivax]|nr:hypothetical protein TRVL_05085 [Trypanosoma vivax]
MGGIVLCAMIYTPSGYTAVHQNVFCAILSPLLPRLVLSSYVDIKSPRILYGHQKTFSVSRDGTSFHSLWQKSDEAVLSCACGEERDKVKFRICSTVENGWRTWCKIKAISLCA